LNDGRLRENRGDRRRLEAPESSLAHHPRTYSEEEAFAKAIELSKISHENEQSRRLNDDEQLQKAIEISEREAIKRKTREREEMEAKEKAKAYF
jgi:hypothetical protein